MARLLSVADGWILAVHGRPTITREDIIDFLLELLLEVILNILGEILFEGAAEFAWESLEHAAERKGKRVPLLSTFGCLAMGLLAGVISLLVFARRVTDTAIIPGASLILAPIGTGFAMKEFGDMWYADERERPVLLTFRGAAVFAFAMALVRFVYLELHWNPF